MPIHLAPVSRRDFLKSSAAALAGLSVMRVGYSAPSTDSCTLALISDPHIAADPATVSRGVNMTANLQRIVEEINQLPAFPQGVIVNGDCAHLQGKPEDYANFAKCIQPLADKGHSVHMTMGNHDERGAFYGVLKNQQSQQPLVESRHVSLIETPFANLFLLDSLKQVNVVTGELGEAQRTWLGEVLDAHADKPAVLMAHHTLQLVPPEPGKRWGGIADTAEFLELMQSRKHVKAYVFGHSHRWSQAQEGNLQLINLPAASYIFDQTQPTGWTLARLNTQGMEFQLHAIDTAHPQHRQVFKFDW